jgi:hypothetical protein
MGVTYKALDINLRCPVTLKVISERYLGELVFFFRSHETVLESGG